MLCARLVFGVHGLSLLACSGLHLNQWKMIQGAHATTEMDKPFENQGHLLGRSWSCCGRRALYTAQTQLYICRNPELQALAHGGT